MKKFVLDASVALRWILDKRMPPYAQRMQRLIGREEAQPVVPNLWHLEMGDGVVMAERRKVLDRGSAARAFALLEQMAAKVNTDSSLDFPGRRAVAAARQYHITVYDAVYLVLAIHLGLALATLDSQLEKAAEAAGVAIFG